MILLRYYGVFYCKQDAGWFCDLIDEPFKTKKEIKKYIKDWYYN